MSKLVLPTHWNVGHNSVDLNNEDIKSVLNDPRGILHVWEPPLEYGQYIMALDPTHGITGWSRYTRLDGDHKTDNAAIEIYRVNALQNVVIDPETDKPKIDKATGRPEFVLCDLQVAEWFAPVDPVEAARVANILGKIYCGNADEQCELIYESYPGPGILTTQELLRVGYRNLWEWEYIADSVAESTGKLGWRSSETSQRMLWIRSKRHLLSRRVKINSPWLLAELRDAVLDPNKMRGVAASGVHDDLLQASSMAFWAGHKWAYDIEHTPQIATQIAPTVDWQRMAPEFGRDKVSARDQWRDLVDSWGE